MSTPDSTRPVPFREVWPDPANCQQEDHDGEHEGFAEWLAAHPDVLLGAGWALFDSPRLGVVQQPLFGCAERTRVAAQSPEGENGLILLPRPERTGDTLVDRIGEHVGPVLYLIPAGQELSEHDSAFLNYLMNLRRDGINVPRLQVAVVETVRVGQQIGVTVRPYPGPPFGAGEDSAEWPQDPWSDDE